MGAFFYGNSASIAGGVTGITSYEANDYINTVLNFASGDDPVAQAFKVQNHSWIGSTANDAADTNILQRLDYTIDMQEMTTLVGLNNGVVALPNLLSNSYNAIFTFFGTLFLRRGMVIGLLFAVVVEGLLSLAPAVISRITTMYYLRTVALRIYDQPVSSTLALVPSGESVAVALLVMLLIALAALGAACLVVTQREYVVTEQL